MESYLSDRKAIIRLKKDYHTHDGSLIIGCDFDNTIFDLEQSGQDLTPVIDLIKECNRIGFTVCMWSALTDDWSLTYKKAISKLLGIHFDYYNESPVLNDSRKPHFNILLDDRAGLSAAYNILKTTIKELDL